MKVLIITISLLGFSIISLAQHTVDVHGIYSYTIEENDHVSLIEAKNKCIDMAKAEAIKAEFGELITSDVIVSDEDVNGNSSSTFYENIAAKAKGDWLGDSKESVITVVYENNKLTFTAEVWGEAREIVQAKADFNWKILCGGITDSYESSSFKNRDRIYVSFQAPADGYVAIYLLEGTDEASCLLPWSSISCGRYNVNSGKKYVFFDKGTDPDAPPYILTTKKNVENNQIVLIYSPNPFTKCIDTKRDSNHANSLTSRDFQKWLLAVQRKDSEMVVDKKWVKIVNE